MGDACLRTNDDKKWPDALIALLRSEWAKGTLTGELIQLANAHPKADRVFTKGAILGMKNRLGLNLRHPPWSHGRHAKRAGKPEGTERPDPVVKLVPPPAKTPQQLSEAFLKKRARAKTQPPLSPPEPPQPTVDNVVALPRVQIRIPLLPDGAVWFDTLSKRFTKLQVMHAPPSGRCQYPVGDLGTPDFHFCGERVWNKTDRLYGESYTYCEHHAKLCRVRRAAS
jgi:GcrA cell cycle regulator